MLKMVDGTGIIGVDMVCPLGGAVSPPQPPNYDNIEMEGVGSLMLPNSLKAPIERVELIGGTEQFTTTGKNLLNIPFIDGSVRETPIRCNFEKNTFIHAEILPKSIQSNVWRIKVVYKDNTIKYVIDSDMQKGSLFVASPENPIVSINYRGLYITEGRYEKIQVEHGVKVTPYEPYTGGKPSPSPEYPQEIKSAGKWNEGTQKYEIDVKVTNSEQGWTEEQTLTLTSDRPITKWDKLVEQGGEYGWLYSGEIAKEFTFVSKASDENISGRIRRRFKTSLNGKFPQTDKVMCNFLTTDNVRNDYSIGIVGSGDIYIYFYENTGVETLEQANHWLKNLPFEKTIIFERKNSQFIPLSESKQTQLRNLHSYNGTTHITADSGEVPCGIKLTYRKEI